MYQSAQLSTKVEFYYHAIINVIIVSIVIIVVIIIVIIIVNLIVIIAGLDVKATKCACFYGRRSGNNWYTGKRDVVPAVSIQGSALATYQRKEPYKYLGKSLSVFGEDEEQIAEFISEYKILIGKIKLCKLPLALKSAALNNLALAKILHHFYNTRLSEKQLNDRPLSHRKCQRAV